VARWLDQNIGRWDPKNPLVPGRKAARGKAARKPVKRRR
jgi:hypothetical protein